MPQSPSYTKVGRVSDIRRGETSIDRRPVCWYHCEGQCLRKKVAPADRAENGGILAPQGFATASLELQAVVDQSHAAAQGVLGKPTVIATIRRARSQR